VNIIPHDRNTFLVESRSVPGEHHIVDLEERTCSCKGFEINKTCDHLKALMSQTETPELELAPEQPGEAPMKQLAPYDEFKAKIESLKKTAESITVTDISQTAEMKIARTTRLALKDIRISIEHRHKELKADILVQGRKIDAGKNELLAVLEPLELRLKDQEEFIERETARIQSEKRIARIAEITPFLSAPPLVDLGLVKDDAYAGMLQDAKDAHAARLAREQREKEEAEAKAKAEAEERERIRVENERLKKEAAEREAAAKAEREAAEKARLEAEESARKEREAAAAKLREANEKAERERKEAAEKARKEREAIEAKARADKEAAEAQARKEREAERLKMKQDREAEEAKMREQMRKNEEAAALDRKIAEDQRQRAEALQKSIREQEAKLKAKIDAEESEKKRLAKAPDKEKLLAFAEVVWSLKIPVFATEEGKLVGEKLAGGIKKLGTWIETKAGEL
jgi:colicin import membrane protein